jgi:hypothetical protein
VRRVWQFGARLKLALSLTSVDAVRVGLTALLFC